MQRASELQSRCSRQRRVVWKTRIPMCLNWPHNIKKHTHLKPASILFSLSELKGKPKHSMVHRSDCGTSLRPLFLLNGKLLWRCNTSDVFALLLLPTGLSSPSSSWHFLVYTHSQGKKREKKIDRSVQPVTFWIISARSAARQCCS